MKAAFALAIAAVLFTSDVVTAQSAPPKIGADPLTHYLIQESARIFREGDRVLDESKRLKAEAARLEQERVRLRTEASALDRRWNKAHQANPALYRNYKGRDRSQKIMRADAVQLAEDSKQLEADSRSLKREAVRLWRLAAAVNPDAQKDLLDRLRRCCSVQAGLSVLQEQITTLAQAHGVNYRPSKAATN